MRRINVNRDSPDERELAEAVRAIRAGGVIAVPTDTLYGLAADPFCARAVDRVFAVKGRTTERALPLIAANAEQLHDAIGALPPLA
jgi:L-threonylcarbamoyladenylate synthase